MNSPADDRRTSRQPAAATQGRGRLFRQSVFWLAAMAAVALLANHLIGAWFAYQEQRALLILTQRQQVEAAATRVGQFIKDIENQMGWLIQLPANAGTLDEWHFESVRVLRQVPAITELARIDAAGREQVRVSRIAMDVIGGQADLSRDTKFVHAMASKGYHSPVYFRSASEPYMTLAIAGARQEYGVVAAEVNLKFIWNVVSNIKVPMQGTIFVVDETGRLIAHPDISLVLRNTDLSQLAYVRAALARSLAPVTEQSRDHDIRNKQALTMMYAPIPSLGWTLILCQRKSLLHRAPLPFCVPADPASHPDTARVSLTRFASYNVQTMWSAWL